MLKILNSWLQLTPFLLVLSATSALADQAPATQAAAPAQPSMAGMMMPFLLMFGVIWMMVLRPQQKRVREQQDLLKSLKHGDEVLTSSGILGKIIGITDKFVTLEVENNVRFKMLKSQVAQVVKGQAKDLA
jgi:preprotein translocase subunit YajC